MGRNVNTLYNLVSTIMYPLMIRKITWLEDILKLPKKIMYPHPGLKILRFAPAYVADLLSPNISRLFLVINRIM